MAFSIGLWCWHTYCSCVITNSDTQQCARTKALDLSPTKPHDAVDSSALELEPKLASQTGSASFFTALNPAGLRQH